MDSNQIKALGKVLRLARKARSMSLKEVGAAAGTSPQAVGQWERGENGPSMSKLIAVCKLLDIDADAAMRGEFEFPPTKPTAKLIRPAGPERSEVEKVAEGWPDLGDDWIDVRGVTVGGDDSYFYFGDVIDQVRRPPGIKNAKNVAALNVAGESMIPRYFPGELIYVQQREPAPGDHVVVEMYAETEDEAPKSFLKVLRRRTGRRLHCEQYNPAIDIEFDAGEVKTVWRVLTLRDLLG